MFIEQIKSEGLAHLSYVIGGEGCAAVIDPRRDCDLYLEIAARNDCRVTHIFETHRNEDLVSGAPVLAAKTGASVYHGPNAAGDVKYAQTAREGDRFTFGDVRLTVMETPGHTDDSLSFAAAHTTSGDDVLAVFTGDALFVSDVGRTDFYPDRAREVAGLLYDSLRKLSELGDQVIVYPAHGSGSVCGSQMANRDFSTIGYEKRHNPRLQIADREKFIDAKVSEQHDTPPYFRHMEKLNLLGAAPIAHPIAPPPLTMQAFKRAADDGVLVDVRSTSAFLGSHLPTSLALPLSLLSSFAGWLLDPEDSIVLIADDAEQAGHASRLLARIGYDQVRGFLAPSLPAWAAAGESFGGLPVVDVDEVRNRLSEERHRWSLLDVRSDEEVEELSVPGSRHIYVGELPARLDELDKELAYTVMCASGARATIAASVLLRAGCQDVDLFLGSVGAWKASSE